MAAVGSPLDVVRQFVANFERRQRNLVKRKCKLDHYREMLNKGEVLNEEQKKAVEGYENVLQSINMVQEVINQSKELVDDVEEAAKQEESSQDVNREHHTLSFLHTHLSLMRLLESLDSTEVRQAITRASSENQLKMLDTVRNLVSAPLVDNWPGVSSACLANAPAFLQAHHGVGLAAQNTYNFVMGRSIPFPVPDDYEGSHKKFNFKEARTLCFRLLATPVVSRSLGVPSYAGSASSSVHDEPRFEPVGEPVVDVSATRRQSCHEITDQVPDPEIEETVEDAEETTHLNNKHVEVPPTPVILDQVIKPLGGTFNFLQASNVIASDPVMEILSVPSCADGHNSAHMASGISDVIEDRVAEQPPVSEEYYAPLPHDNLEDLYNMHADNHLEEAPHIVPSSPPSSVPVEEEPEPVVAVSSRPISYADLVRRPGHARPPSAQYEQYSSLEVRKSERTTMPPVVVDSGDNESASIDAKWVPPPRRGTSDFRGGRGGRNFARGNSGPPRRAMGGARSTQFGAGPGRGSRGAYRGTPASIAQPSY